VLGGFSLTFTQGFRAFGLLRSVMTRQVAEKRFSERSSRFAGYAHACGSKELLFVSDLRHE